MGGRGHGHARRGGWRGVLRGALEVGIYAAMVLAMMAIRAVLSV